MILKFLGLGSIFGVLNRFPMILEIGVRVCLLIIYK